MNEKNILIDNFLKEELKNNKGKIINQTTVDLAKKFNDKYPNKKFYFDGKLSPVNNKSIHYRILNNPNFKKNIALTSGRKIDSTYQDKIDRAIEVYKKLPEEKKRALRTGGVGYTGALDKFMEENDLFRESSKYGNKMNQRQLDKNFFSTKLKQSGVERPKLIPVEEGRKKQKLRRKEILGTISSTSYESHLDNFKRDLQKYLGIKKSKLSTGKEMFPLDLAHKTDIDQLYTLKQKMDPSDLGIDFYKTNREFYKNIETTLSNLYDEQNKLYKQAKKLNKVPEELSKKIFLNNDQILQTIGESPFKDRLKPITINPVTLEVKRGSVITDDITKQLGIGLVETPMNKIKIGSEEDAIIKLNLTEQVVNEANELGLIKNINKARELSNKFLTGSSKQKGLPGKYKLLTAAVASPLLLAAGPAKSNENTQVENQPVVPQQQRTPITEVADISSAAKIADDLVYDDFRKVFVKRNEPEVKATQSDLLYWLADNPITESPIASIGVGTAALSIPGAKETFEAARKADKGILRSTASILGKGLTRVGSPAGTALFEVPFIAEQIQEGRSPYDILSDPLNYIGPAFTESLTRGAGAIKGPPRGFLGGVKDTLTFEGVRNPRKAAPGLLNLALRLGLSPRNIALISGTGAYGAIAATGLTAFDLANAYRKGELDNLFSSEETDGVDLSKGVSIPGTLDTSGIMGLKNET
jgi:hypothetical protein